MIDTCLIKQFRYDWRRRVEPPARRIYQMDDSQIDRSRETIENYVSDHFERFRDKWSIFRPNT